MQVKKEELINAFKYAVRLNELYDNEAIVIPKEMVKQFVNDFYKELISSEECKKRKQYYFNYIKKVMLEKEWYINELTVLEFVNEYIHDDNDFADVKLAFSVSKNWSGFWKYVEKVFAI